MIKKKQTTSPPQKITHKDNYFSPRNAPQEAIVSDTSIGNAEELINRKSNTFYSPEYRAEISHHGKVRSPQNNKRTVESKTSLSTGQKAALAELEKAKQNKMLKSTTQRVRVPSNQQQPWQSMASPKKKTNTMNITPIAPIHQQQWQSQKQQIPEVYAGQTFSPKEENHQELAEFQYKFPNGDCYNGTWRGKYIEGSGVYDFTKQNLQYRGEFKESRQHGRGTLLRKPVGNNQREDIIYQGQWMNGFKEGFGKYYYFKDTYYQGNWIQNTKQGHGTFKNSEGEYTGEWKNDKKHGRGTLKLNNGTTLEGEFQNDVFTQGTVIYSNGDRYEGDCQNFSRQGFGTYTYGNSQTQYKGSWDKNIKNGAGTIHYPNGDKYQGGVVNNIREGTLCHYEWKETGDKISGQFGGDLPKRGRIFIQGEGEYEFNLAK